MNVTSIFTCRNCGEGYADSWDAQTCCPPDETYKCGECGTQHYCMRDAEYCCTPAQKAEDLEKAGQQRFEWKYP